MYEEQIARTGVNTGTEQVDGAAAQAYNTQAAQQYAQQPLPAAPDRGFNQQHSLSETQYQDLSGRAETTQTIDTRAFKLAQAIRDNGQLREEFLKIINQQSAAKTPQAIPQQVLQRPAQTQQSYNQSLETPKSGADFFTEFESYRPGFFKSAPARVQLKDYLMKNCPDLPRDELYRVINLAVNLENQAVQAFKSRLSHQNSLINGNEAAKEHLATSSACPKNQDFSHAKIFSRKEISKMSAKEFRQNEREIFAQYRDGLIL